MLLPNILLGKPSRFGCSFPSSICWHSIFMCTKFIECVRFCKYASSRLCLAFLRKEKVPPQAHPALQPSDSLAAQSQACWGKAQELPLKSKPTVWGKIKTNIDLILEARNSSGLCSPFKLLAVEACSCHFLLFWGKRVCTVVNSSLVLLFAVGLFFRQGLICPGMASNLLWSWGQPKFLILLLLSLECLNYKHASLGYNLGIYKSLTWVNAGRVATLQSFSRAGSLNQGQKHIWLEHLVQSMLFRSGGSFFLFMSYLTESFKLTFGTFNVV